MGSSTSPAAILGFDTATDDSAIAVMRGDEVVFERRVDAVAGERPRHARELLATIAEAASAAGGFQEIGVIAVGVGPGTFTGLRIGVATARALGQGLAMPLAAVGSLATLAAGIGEHAAADARPRLAVIDARRREAFAALFTPGGETMWEPFVAAPEEIATRLKERSQADGVAPLAAGSGSLRFRTQLEAADTEVLADDEPAHRIQARHVCRLGAAITPVEPELIEPTYLRRPDAELWREQQRRDRD